MISTFYAKKIIKTIRNDNNMYEHIEFFCYTKRNLESGENR